MTITPYFTIHQTISHVELDIRVPHVRVTPESIQVVIMDNSILHFASPPYLLILNFAALHDTDNHNAGTGGDGADVGYRFDETANEACATYEPTIENGMIHLSLKKASNVAKLWTNLHLLGRMVLPRIPKVSNNLNSNQIKNSSNKNNPTSQWLLEEVDSTRTTTTTTSSSIEEDVQTLPDDANKRISMKRRQKGYGFGSMFDGIFNDLTRDGLAKEMLECSPDDENEDTLLAVDVHDDDESVNEDIDDSLLYSLRRRIQRRQMENDKFDPDRYRQDLDVDDDYIYQCAMAMKPHWITMQQQQECASSSCCSVNSGGGNVDIIESITKRLDSLVVAENNGPPQPSNEQQQQIESHYFTEEERLQLVSIPYPLLAPETRLTLSTSCCRSQEQQNGDKDNDNNDNDLTITSILVGLIDLLFAYVYDHLTTDGDATVESAWTVSILSASLSWMEDWQHLTCTTTTTTTATQPTSGSSSNLDDNLLERTVSTAPIQEVLYSSLRRALIYPYLRNLCFALHCATQVADILHNGPCCILRCLLQLRNVLNHSELYYLGNKLFIDPYLAWIQQQNSIILSRGLVDMSQVIHQMVSAFDKNITTSMEECKQRLGLDLIRIENENEAMGNHRQDDEHSSSSSSSPDSDAGDDDDDDNDSSSSNSEEEQSHDDDDDDDHDKITRLSSLTGAQSPETRHKEQQRSEEKGTTAVSSELLDCSLGFSALHIVKPSQNNAERESFMFSPAIITDESHLKVPSTTGNLTEEDPSEELSSLPSTPKKLIVELDD